MIDGAGLVGYDGAVNRRYRLFHEETEEDILSLMGTNFTNNFKNSYFPGEEKERADF